MPSEVWPAVASHWSRPEFYAGMRSHIQSIPDTVTEMHAAEPIRAIPVTVLTPGNAVPLSEEDLERIGDRVQQVIAAKSEHWIQLDEPELVIDSIRAMVDATVSEPVAGDQNRRRSPLLIRPRQNLFACPLDLACQAIFVIL